MGDNVQGVHGWGMMYRVYMDGGMTYRVYMGGG